MANILRAGIAVDDWKLPIFKQILAKEGYSFEDKGKFMQDVTLLVVETDNISALGVVIQGCQDAAAASKLN